MSAAQTMSIEQALSVIGLEDRFEDLDQTILPMMFDGARIDHPGQRTEQAIAVLEAAMADPIPTMTIDENGDVMLVVGVHQQRKLQVSADSLSKASTVFEALFGPHFREGQAERSPENPVEISLPDDDPRAMTRLCEMLHLRRTYDETMVVSINSEAMLGLAILIDKYDVADFVRPEMQGTLLGWFYDHSAYCDMLTMSNMIASAYLLGQTRAFSMLTNQFLIRGFNAVTSLLSERSGQLYPTMVLLALSERRGSGLAYPKGLCLLCLRDNADIVSICNKHIVR